MNPISSPLALLLLFLLAIPASLALPAPTARALERPVDAPRWFSAPHSRVVLNPFMASPPLMEDGVVTNLAVYAGEQPHRLPSAWTWQMAAPAGITEGPVLPMTAEDWDAVDVTPAFEASGARLVLDDATHGSLTARVTVDLDRTPFLSVNVHGLTGAWALKVAPDGADNRDERSDITLRMDTAETGARTFNVRRATGWTGQKTFRVRLFVVGGKGRAARFSGLRFFGPAHTSKGLEIAGSTWAPDRLTARATAPGSRSVDARTALAGEGTVWQIIGVRAGGPSTLVLVGQWPDGEGSAVEWDAKGRAVTLETAGLRGRIGISRAARWLGVFPAWEDWLARKGGGSGPGGIWALALDGVAPGEEIALRADFAPAAVGGGPAPTVAEARAAFRESEAAWNARLARVPRPLSFTLSRAEPKGITAEALRRTYYDAWAFLFADILPPMPENGYPYPQVACGKPSLWGEGHPRARASAQWESIIGMQFLAMAEPDAAWRAFEGMMSLVDADGSMNGEGLPSWHMQAAWALYAHTSDADRLRAAYPDMKRLLLWKAADPRWIHKGATKEGTKDTEFVVHALLDMDYATRIARALGMADETAAWEKRRMSLAADYRKWFFGPSGHTPYRLYDAATSERHVAGDSWALQGIALPPDALGATERDALLRLFDRLNGEEDTFLIPNFTKHPHYSRTARGLWRYGRHDDLARLTETYMRDVVRAGEFAEQYVQDDPPTPDGVRPSLFGALIMIEAALRHNGVTLTEGFFALESASGGGVENLRVRDRALNARFAPDAKVTLSGPALSVLDRPASFTGADGAWLGTVPPTSLVVLTPHDRGNMRASPGAAK